MAVVLGRGAAEAETDTAHSDIVADHIHLIGRQRAVEQAPKVSLVAGAGGRFSDGGAIFPLGADGRDPVGQGGRVENRGHGEGLAVAGEVAVDHRYETGEIGRLTETSKMGFVPSFGGADGHRDISVVIAKT